VTRALAVASSPAQTPYDGEVVLLPAGGTPLRADLFNGGDVLSVHGMQVAEPVLAEAAGRYGRSVAVIAGWLGHS
jgi:hypothetical protein